MSILDYLSQQWFAWIGAVSWQLAVLVCIVAVVGRIARTASARLRHGLWLLVLAKVFLPPVLSMPCSVGYWGIGPLLDQTGLAKVTAEMPFLSGRPPDGETPVIAREQSHPSSAANRIPRVPAALMVLWACGCLLFCGIVGWRYAAVSRATRTAASIDEGPLRVALEQIAMRLGLRRIPDLLTVETIASPFLIGVIRPRIVLPEALLRELGDIELRAVLTHELVHWKRRDTWIGWLQVLAQGLFWFHPFLWWANSKLRHERECVCDETVLRLGHITPEKYGESIFRVLTASRGRSLVAGSLVGVFERGAKLQNRLEDIMNHDPTKREFGWASRLALAAFAVLFLPMAPGAVESRRVEAQEGNRTKDATQASKTSYPQIIKTTPKQGASSVDHGLTEISVTFDRDMGKGMSWTGQRPLYPPIDKKRQARWRDARTCVLPVKLEKASYYRLSINSSSRRNFRSSDGVPAPPSVIYFTTQGATKTLERRIRVPKIVEIEPENGAGDVDPATKVLRVTFDMPMGEGMSWTGGGPQFPKIAEGKKPRWSRDGRTCTLPVSLEPGHDYQIGLNSLSHINFQSKWGVPLQPVTYRFRTRAKGK